MCEPPTGTLYCSVVPEWLPLYLVIHSTIQGRTGPLKGNLPLELYFNTQDLVFNSYDVLGKH